MQETLHNLTNERVNKRTIFADSLEEGEKRAAVAERDFQVEHGDLTNRERKKRKKILRQNKVKYAELEARKKRKKDIDGLISKLQLERDLAVRIVCRFVASTPSFVSHCCTIYRHVVSSTFSFLLLVLCLLWHHL